MSGLWTDRFNWEGDVAPVAGDDLVFPLGAARLANTNSFPIGTSFREVRFTGDGYEIFGNSIALEGTLTTENGSNTTNAISLNVLLNSPTTINALNANAVLVLFRNVNLGGNFLTVQGPGQVELRGLVSGTAGLIKEGSGTLRLAGSAANTYRGPVTINGGTLLVGQASALGTTSAGTTLNGDATLRLERDVRVGAEALILNTTGKSSNPAASVHAGGGSNRWAGPIALATNATIHVGLAQVLNLSGAISGSGGLTKAGTNTLIFSGGAGTANTYTGRTFVMDGTLLLAKTILNSSIRGPLTIGDGGGEIGADVVRLQGVAQIGNTSSVTIASTGLLDLNGEKEDIGSLAGVGTASILLNNGSLTVGLDNTSTDYAGLISGAGGLTKSGTGTLTLSATNFYTGPTLVNAGTLRVMGAGASSQHTVNNAGTLGGRGLIGPCNVAGGILAPGPGVGRLTSGNISFNSASEFVVELNGPVAGLNYDQLKVEGTVALGSSALVVSVDFPPTEGEQFVILDNDGTEPVSGTFASLPEGALLPAGDLSFRISYTGGSGNDIVLTLTNTALAVSSAAVLDSVPGGNMNGSLDPSECAMLTVALTNLSSRSVTGIRAILSSETKGVSVIQSATLYPDIPPGGSATNLISFRLSTGASLDCATNVQFKLTVFTSNEGAFSIPLVLSPSCTSGTGPCEPCARIAGAITPDDSLQQGRLFRDLNPSVCGSGKPCPTIFNPGAPFHFDAHTFLNGASEACITVTLSSSCPLTSAAYLDQHNPTNLCQNYLGDLGDSVSANASASYSFTVPARAAFVVVVVEVFALCDYELSVTGDGCLPALSISRRDAAQVVLDWPASAPAYRLETSDALPPDQTPAWVPVASPPNFDGGRFYVTNPITGLSRFFRLHQP